MNIREAIEQLESAVRSYTARDADGLPLIPAEAQRPLYLIGPPGVGKTAIVHQAARRLGVGLVSYTMTHHTRQSALGLPRIVERSFGGEMRACTEYTMSEILAGVYRCREDTGADRGILFLDEINCVSETLTPAMLELLQHKRFGQHALPEGWVVVCAGNPEEYNRSARAFDAVTLDRLRVLRIEANLDAWMDYAARRGVHHSVRGYLLLRPEDFCVLQGERVVTPRSWTDLSDMMRALEAMGEAPGDALYAQYLQCPAVAEGFGLYRGLCRGVSERFALEDALAGGAAEAEAHFAGAPFDEALCAAMLLASCLNGRAAEAVRQEETAARLQSFAEGVLRAGGDCLCAMKEQLKRMEHAAEVRKRAGVLTEAAEAGERALFRAVRAAMAAVAGAADAAAALRDHAAAQSARARKARKALETDFSNGLAFAGRAFANVHVRVIFVAELERAPASLRLLRVAPNGIWQALRASVDPDARAAELKRRLAAMDGE